MAFIEQKSQSKKEMAMTGVLVVLILTTALVWYFGFVREPKQETAQDTTSAKEKIQLLNVEATKTTLNEVGQNISLINDKFFSNLRMYGEDLRAGTGTKTTKPVSPPPTKGRINPFLPY